MSYNEIYLLVLGVVSLISVGTIYITVKRNK